MKVTFRTYDPDPKDSRGEEKGFKCVRIEALSDEKRVGYIKISTLSDESFSSKIPSVWHYLKIWQGLQRVDLDAYRSEDVHALFNSICGYQGMPPAEGQSWSLADKVKALAKVEDRVRSEIDVEMASLLNTAEVDFIEVDVEKRRYGLGALLYQKADEYAANFGLKFRSSRIQSEDAINTWDKLVEKGLAVKNDQGHYELID